MVFSDYKNHLAELYTLDNIGAKPDDTPDVWNLDEPQGLLFKPSSIPREVALQQFRSRVPQTGSLPMSKDIAHRVRNSDVPNPLLRLVISTDKPRIASLAVPNRRGEFRQIPNSHPAEYPSEFQGMRHCIRGYEVQ